MRPARTLLALPLVLAACGGGDSDGGAGFCVGSFQGGDTGFGCTACSGVDPFNDNPLPETIDNNGATSRTVGLDNGGSITISIRAPSGISFPAGVDGGAKIRFPEGVNVTATFSLYNGNAPVTATSGATISNGTPAPGAGSDSYYAVEAAATYNRIDLALTPSGNIQRANFVLYEFCGDR